MAKHSDINAGIPTPNPLLRDENSAALRLGVPVHELRIWRREKRGPAFVMIGVRAFYKDATLERFIAEMPESNSRAQALARNPDRAAKAVAQAARAAQARTYRNKRASA
jgi:hypothetical protein